VKWWQVWTRRIAQLFSKNGLAQWANSRGKARRRAWDESAHWARLRYDDQHKANEMLSRLSESAKMIGLRFRQDGSALKCWVGVAPRYAPVLKKMAPTFGCLLEDVAYTDLPTSIESSLKSIQGLPDDVLEADVYVVLGHGRGIVRQQDIAYIDLDKIDATDGEGKASLSFFPTEGGAPDGDGLVFSLPQPVLGIGRTPSLHLESDRALLRPQGGWLLGYDQQRYAIGAKQAGVVGDNPAVFQWMLAFSKANLEEHRPGLVLLDGEGELFDNLARHPYIKRMIASGEIVTFDARVPQVGFNPLVPHRDMDMDKTWARWQWLFRVMGLDQSVIDSAVRDAFMDGADNFPALYHWMKRHATQYPEASIVVRSQIDRLNKDEPVGEWLLNPKNFLDPRTLAESSSILITARNSRSWTRQMAMYGFVGLMAEVNASLSLYSLPLPPAVKPALAKTSVIVAHNKLPLTLVTRCDPKMAQQVAAGEVSAEHLALLPNGTGVIRGNDKWLSSVSWKVS
jgi:hypothetical protein